MSIDASGEDAEGKPRQWRDFVGVAIASVPVLLIGLEIARLALFAIGAERAAAEVMGFRVDHVIQHRSGAFGRPDLYDDAWLPIVSLRLITAGSTSQVCEAGGVFNVFGQRVPSDEGLAKQQLSALQAEVTVPVLYRISGEKIECRLHIAMDTAHIALFGGFFLLALILFPWRRRRGKRAI
jgi:hypothetical protein